jgi:hypothetical protein
MKSHRRSLISMRPNESTNDPLCSESSANREPEGRLRSALIGRARRDRIGRAHLQCKIPKRGPIYA